MTDVTFALDIGSTLAALIAVFVSGYGIGRVHQRRRQNTGGKSQ